MNNTVIDDNLFNFILSNIKFLRNIVDLPENPTSEQVAEYNNTIAILTLLINTICSEIMIKTNRTKFPEDLKYLAINMVDDMYGQYLNDANSDSNNAIQSMSEDGRSVNFGVTDYFKTKMQLLIQQRLANNATLINRYRLLYKVRCPLEDEQN